MNAMTENTPTPLQTILGIAAPMDFITHDQKSTSTTGLDIALEIMSSLAEAIIGSGGVHAYINKLCSTKNKVLLAQGTRMKEAIAGGQIPENELVQTELSVTTLSILAMAQMPDSKTDLILLSSLIAITKQCCTCNIKASMSGHVSAIAQYLENAEAAASHRMTA